MATRSEWKSKTGFLLAALGSAIGLGNIWRFPYIAYRNGGGAFLIPYFIALFVVGVPLLMLEFGLGHHSRRAFPQAMARIHPRFSWIGWWAVSFVMFGIVAYYGVVIAWCGQYFFFVLTQPWGDVSNVNSFFDTQFTGSIENNEPFAIYTKDAGFQFGRFNIWTLVALAVIWLLNWLIARRELQRGIELANRIFIPLLVAITLVLVLWSWGFPGADVGRELYLKPDWSRVFDPKTWIDAFSQIFFTLSLGFGIMVAYASYLPRDTDIPTSAFLAAMGNCVFSLVAGFAVFAAIGLLAHEQDIDLRQLALESSGKIQVDEDIPIDEVAVARRAKFQEQMSTFGLLFKTYPAITTHMGGISGRLFGALFFLSLIVAGISSSISIIEAFLAALHDEFSWDRQRVAAFLCAAGFLLGTVFCAQSGLFWLDLVDHFITTYGLVLVAVCESLIVGWLFPARKMRSHLDEYHVFRFGPIFSIAMRVLLTAILLLTWIGLAQYQPESLGGAMGRFLIAASAVILWIDEHWLDFNTRLVIPALLIFLLDQALFQELKAPYGGYPLPAVLGIGFAWLLGTLAIGIGFSYLSRRGHADAGD